MFALILYALATEPLPRVPPIPKDNPMSAAKVRLGKKLFFDKRLSVDNSVSCNSCHNVSGGGVDNLPFSKGVKGKRGGRNAPTVWNAAFLSVQFWDGRATSLEEQARGPITNPGEMGMKNDSAVVDKLRKIGGYRKEFRSVFGGDITMDRITQAIASYERTLITPNAPFDRFIRGDRGAMTPLAQRGWKAFRAVGCASCHSGVNFAGPSLPMGTGFYQPFPAHRDTGEDVLYNFSEDLGRYGVTLREEDRHRFRVPTLRNVELTSPYFHNGSVGTLDEAVRVMARLQLNKELSGKQVGEIVAFLEALTGQRPKQDPPTLPN